MASELVPCGVHYYILHNERNVFPERGRCYDRAQAVSYIKSMIKNRYKGPRLYSVQMHRDMKTGTVWEDHPVWEKKL